MCGIAGIWGSGDIEKMVNTLSHRGPHGTGFYKNEEVRLGACSLKITDPEGENQPCYNEDKTICAILNGEIYNYIELKNELSNHIFKTQTDTEVIVHAYEEYGLDFIHKLNGCFAIAIWDGGRIILIRDRLGQKPLYYYFKNKNFFFASEIKSILTQMDSVSPNLTENFLTFETTIGSETFFKDVYALPSASLLIFNGEDVKTKKYWQVPPDIEIDFTPKQYIEKLQWLIQDSVRLRLRGGTSVGILLSGGIDSSLLAYIARPQYAFTCCYGENGSFNEVEYASMVAKDIGAQHFLVKPTSADFKEHFEKIIWHLDQPVATMSSLPAYLLAKKASEYVKIILNGEGSDEFFGGYIRYLLMVTEERLGALPELKNFHPLARFFWNKNMFSGSAERYFELIKRGEAGKGDPFQRVKEIFSQHKNLLNSMTACDIEVSLPSLLMMADRVCGAFGLENRSPFFDYRIVEFAFSLPQEMKIREFKTKYILREAARGIVPDKIIDRRDKIGLITPIYKWFSQDLSEWCNSITSTFDERNIPLNPGKDRGLYDRYKYMKLSLELWYRIFIDKQLNLDAAKKNKKEIIL
ncbi:MAG: asparagine synthase (glutamine-hydrolyzing) [Spirochaetes bacterium]|nr:MAG: asparagine synthase (glutamine-hydrolyzing) [Spirochaetota bacterium]